MSADWNEWLDKVAAGEKPDAGSFASAAIGKLPRIETKVRGPSRRDVWPPEVWAEMERIRKGEGECQ